MTVNNIQASILETLSSQYASTDTTSSSNSSSMMEMDDFLTVFLAQLQYQDPLNPLEATDMTAQLSAISTVEQLYNVNEKLDTVSTELEGLSASDPLGYIGKDVLVEGNEIAVQDGEPLGATSFSIEEPALVVITIFDAAGNRVREIQYDANEAGSQMIGWGGKDDQGLLVEDGTYTYEVVATDNNGEEVAVNTLSQWRITGIAYESGEPYLLAGDVCLNLADIICVYDSSGDGAEGDSETEN
ncbi:MAG: flagellar hook assembly protein FlgD [Deltaproteobacteria bacterium]|nr:flagellar hook assembly protein FlgD [Deltaproteobacteria bacterium]